MNTFEHADTPNPTTQSLYCCLGEVHHIQNYTIAGLTAWNTKKSCYWVTKSTNGVYKWHTRQQYRDYVMGSGCQRAQIFSLTMLYIPSHGRNCPSSMYCCVTLRTYLLQASIAPQPSVSPLCILWAPFVSKFAFTRLATPFRSVS